MSHQSVNVILERAVEDDSFFQLLTTDPEAALKGYDVTESEVTAFGLGAYNVVVKARRQERLEKAARAAAPSSAGVPVVAVGGPAPEVSARGGRSSFAGLGGFAVGLVLIGAGLGGFRVTQQHWPWEPAAPAAVPASLPSAFLTPSARPASVPPAASSGISPLPTGQADLGVSPAPNAASKAYFQAVGSRLAAFVNSFNDAYTALEAGTDPGADLAGLDKQLADLQVALQTTASPPAQLVQDQQTLVASLPILQTNVTQMKTMYGQGNRTQAILVATQIDGLLQRMPALVGYALEPHPELYQAVETTQTLSHALGFDIVSQNVTRRGYTMPNAAVGVAVQKANPSKDEIVDSAHQAVVASRQSFPQATHVQVTVYVQSNGERGAQVATADWFCGPDQRLPGANPASNWQEDCGKILISTLPLNGNGAPESTTVTY